LFFCGYGFSINDARLLRCPDINETLIAFTYAGDIWTVPAKGGDALRLTSHEGLELYPKISPDGKWIAFSGEYSGTRQIYAMSVKGGTPKQLTFYNDADVEDLPPRGGFDHIPLDWTNDSKKILIKANRTPYGERAGKYFLVSLAGGLETPLQIPEGGFGSFSPDEKKLVYTPIYREFRTWKRYKGGRAQDVWIYDLEKDTSKRITKFTGTDHHPLWYKDKIYFLSDRELPDNTIRLNFWSYDIKSGEFAPVTEHRDYDALWPSGHNGLVAYEYGGHIYKLNLETGNTAKVTVNINFDNPNTYPYFTNVSRYVSRFGVKISPSGKRGVFDARGDIFTVPAKEGITYNLTRTQGVREMYPAWSPDGKWIAYISDQTGDYEIYLLDPKRKEKTIQLTENHKVWKTPPLWSPDSKMLLFYDKNQKLQILDIQSKEITIVDKAKRSDIDDYSWSFDSSWITYSKTGSNNLENIWVYSLAEKKPHLLLDSKYENFSPVFSKNGKFIYFISDRDFDMNFADGFSSMEFDFVLTKTARIFAVALTKDAPKLFEDKNDVEEIKSEKADKPEKKKKNDKSKKKPAPQKIKIDFDGINKRIIVFPLSTERYGFLTDLGDNVLYFKAGGLYLFDMKKKKSELVIKGIRGGDLSADGKKLLYRAGNNYGIIDIKPNQKIDSGKLNMKDVIMKICPTKEWEQVYNEGWRIFRDWFYVKNMHGVDWQKMKERYAELIPYISHRADLDYIFGELIGELNAGHTYVHWGEFRKKVKRIDTGLLGVELKADKKSGRYIIEKIYEGENWFEDTRSPLTEQGIDVKEGDYLISLNGYNVTIKDNPYRFLENTIGKKIEIKVNSKPDETGAKTYQFKPTKSEYELKILDWVNSRRRMIDKLSGGKIGYIFVPNTAVEGNRELFKGLYAYNDKEAFIIDDRYNGGGWSPGKMIEKIAGERISYWRRRGLDLRSEPTFALEGPKVMLINHFSSSGGDNFPYWFKKRNLGPLIGTRTWGGLIGYGWSPGLIDGPSFAVPMSGIVGTDGEYIIEGIGVYPDEGFEVYDRPEEVAKGKDPCVEAAVKYLMEQLAKKPRKIIVNPQDPVRSKWHEKEIK
jgi:tricorn protease